MSEILARIRVRETAGIRRFLYPLQVVILVPENLNPAGYGMADEDARPIPSQISSIHLGDGVRSQEYMLDFAVSLAPFADREYIVAADKAKMTVEDPLQVSIASPIAIHSMQRRFSVSLDWDGFISAVVYDGIEHLRQAMEISRNGRVVEGNLSGPENSLDDALAQGIKVEGIYDADMCDYETRAVITACKSWVTISHTLKQPKPNDEVVFTLPLAITSPTLTCDFGVGGYVFGKLNSKAAEIVWRTEFGDAPYAKWTVSTAGRVDYVGEVESAEAFLPQRWFHLIDSDKALAVAITKLPDGCQSMTVRLTVEGDVTIAFKRGETVTDHADFGVCYHFLNDVPAIAAATNPQSILLPPIVEVL